MAGVTRPACATVIPGRPQAEPGSMNTVAPSEGTGTVLGFRTAALRLPERPLKFGCLSRGASLPLALMSRVQQGVAYSTDAMPPSTKMSWPLT